MKKYFLFVKGGRWKIVFRKPAIQQQSRKLRAMTEEMNKLLSHWGGVGCEIQDQIIHAGTWRTIFVLYESGLLFCSSTTNSYKFSSSLTQMYYLSFREAGIWVQVSWVLCWGLASNKAEILPQSWGLFPSSLVGGRAVISSSKAASQFLCCLVARGGISSQRPPSCPCYTTPFISSL